MIFELGEVNPVATRDMPLCVQILLRASRRLKLEWNTICSSELLIACHRAKAFNNKKACTDTSLTTQQKYLDWQIA